MKSSKCGFWLGLTVLFMITASVYHGTLQNDFVDFDDNIYVTQNENTQAGLSIAGFDYAWTTFDSGNWIPLTWLSYQLDTTILGFDSRSYHATNLALHVLNVLLLFSFLNQVTHASRRSFIVAVAFAVHPLHVESVAWISERKDVLSTFWLLLSLIAYEKYCIRPSVRWYMAVCAAFVMGLLSKSMVVTLPLLMLILDFWPLERSVWSNQDRDKTRKYPVRDPKWLLIEKIPLLGLSLIDGLITVMAQDAGHAVGGQLAGSALSQLPLTIRLGNALIGYWWYIDKTFWPTGLCVYYPHPGQQLDVIKILWAIFFLLLLASYVVVAGRRRPHLFLGGFWYVVSLAPVIGFIQVGSQAYADRYSYVPHIGLLWMIVWEIHAWLNCLKHARIVEPILASLVVLALGWMSVVQVAVWKSTDTLWARVLAVDSDNWFAHLQIGNRRVLSGHPDETAYHHLKVALDHNPANPYALNNIGWIHQNRGEWSEAGKFYRRAITADPSMTESMHNFIVVLKKEGRLAAEAELIHDYTRRKPDDAWTINELGMIAVRQGQMEKARALFEDSLRADPDQRDARVNLALTLSRTGQDSEAKSNLETVLARYPNDTDSHVNLGLLLERLQQYPEALQQYKEALRCNPQDREVSERLQMLNQRLSSP